MENQGFEEEQQQPRGEDSTAFPLESPPSPQGLAFYPNTDDSFPENPALNPEGHVYEDISPTPTDLSSRLSDNPCAQPQCVATVVISKTDTEEFVTNTPQHQQSKEQPRIFNIVDYISREALSRSLDQEGISRTFQRNLTLPFRRGKGLDGAVSSSVRVTNREKNGFQDGDGDHEDDDHPEIPTGKSSKESSLDRAQSTTFQPDFRLGRRRRKKDCKHCRNKTATTNPSEYTNEVDYREREMILKKNRDNEELRYASNSNNNQTILSPRNFGILPPVCHTTGKEVAVINKDGTNSSTIFSISEKIRGATDTTSTFKFIEYEKNDGRTSVGQVQAETKEGKPLIVAEKSRAGMRVNSIYSQDRWYAKDPPIFFTDLKDHGSFQRAYSLPVRTQTPSSQNRVNLRRSVRGEPPPHPARLHKHRHGWTLHLARPLEGSGCTRSLVLLLIVILALLGVGAIALYIVFEPEKLQIIQQYLRSSPSNSSSSNSTKLGGTFLPVENDERNEMSTTPTSSTLVADIPSNDTSLFPSITENVNNSNSSFSGNSTRYCDDCLTGEVCVALVDEEVPICRIVLDPQDPTGCAGFCLINKQKCHRLDIDAFRCVEVEHYCLDDEWTCLNTLCIPLKKHCDGHMNCYDHSDEYNCVCNLETHFQCGNETSCLPLEKRCDGKIDCWDAADEINCTLGRNLGWSCPLENEFTCSDGQCILKARFCDGLPDCVDGSDEPHGCQGRCNKHEFTCQNSRCITKGMKCNGIDDCGDGTDERHCKDRF